MNTVYRMPLILVSKKTLTFGVFIIIIYYYFTNSDMKSVSYNFLLSL